VGEFIVVGEFFIAYIRACSPGDNISWVPQVKVLIATFLSRIQGTSEGASYCYQVRLA